MMSWLSGTIQSAGASSRIYFQISNDDDGEAHLHHHDQVMTYLYQEITQIRERNTSSVPTLNHENEMVNADADNSSRTKRRKLKSKVWKEFTKSIGEDGKEWAICKHCERKFHGSSKKGTTHLKNHLERHHPSKRSPGVGAEVETNDLSAPIVVKEKSVIDKELNHLDAARVIIKYGFSSLKSIKASILHVYREEKEKLRRYFNELPCRFNLKFERFDMEYILIVLYFIDDGWELKKKIIGIDYENCEKHVSEAVKDLLLDLNVEKNICSTVLHTFTDDFDFFQLNFWISERALLPFNENFLPICWLEENLTRYVRNGPKWIEALFQKIRQSFNYVRQTPSNEHSFQIALNKAKSMGKKVTSGGLPKKWISNDLEMFETALGFKEVFYELEQIDPSFMLINLTEQEWHKATATYECVKVLKDAANNLSGRKHATANVYFSKVCDIYMKLLQWEGSDDYYVREIGLCVREICFDKYWRKCNLVLAIAVVLDPRFKMDVVIGWYREIYGKDADTPLKKIINDVTNVYNEYAKGPRMLDELGRPCTSSNSELHLYLNEPRVPSVEDFDILAWWRINSPNFPILTRIARDFLAVPVFSRNGFNSDFLSLSDEISNIFHCDGLDLDIKKALVCTKSWLESSENS